MFVQLLTPTASALKFDWGQKTPFRLTGVFFYGLRAYSLAESSSEEAAIAPRQADPDGSVAHDAIGGTAESRAQVLIGILKQACERAKSTIHRSFIVIEGQCDSALREDSEMLRKTLTILILASFALSPNATPGTSPTVLKLSAAEIVEKNVAARGGLQAWRGVQTMRLTGKLGAGGNQRATLSLPAPEQPPKGQRAIVPHRPIEEVQLPFVMELKRPGKVRFELQFNNQTAIQVFDGVQGWKLRPFLNRREVEPYSPEEMKIASTHEELDGFLIDYAAKGTRLEFDSIEKVEGRDTYKLKLTLKNGDVTHVWVDAQTFIETKVEGQPRRLDGTYHPVEVYYRDYRTVNGLQIPFVLETHVLPVTKTATGFRDTPVPPEKIIIDQVTLNPKLDDSVFSKPQIQTATLKAK